MHTFHRTCKVQGYLPFRKYITCEHAKYIPALFSSVMYMQNIIYSTYFKIKYINRSESLTGTLKNWPFTTKSWMALRSNESNTNTQMDSYAHNIWNQIAKLVTYLHKVLISENKWNSTLNINGIMFKHKHNIPFQTTMKENYVVYQQKI